MDAPLTVSRIAGTIDHSLLHPTLTREAIAEDVAGVRGYPLASVCVKPCEVATVLPLLKGTDIAVCTVVGFPHGTSTTAAKVFETEDAMAAGATEIDMVSNVGKTLARDWDGVRADIEAVLKVTRSRGGILKVIFENDFLPDDNLKIRLCEICGELKADFVKTSTGFGFVKGPDGRYAYAGATEHDIALMRRHSPPEVQVKAAGGIRTLDAALRMLELGVTRIGATATIPILTEAAERFGE